MRWYDFCAWIGFGIVVVYLILKAAGIINSPFTIDVVAIISGAFFVGRYAMKMDMFFDQLKYMKKDMRILSRYCPVLKERGIKAK